MSDTTLPPLPPGFELVEDDALVAPTAKATPTNDLPPIPAGFELVDDAPEEEGLEINITGGTVGEAPSEAELQTLRQGQPSWVDSQMRGLGLGARSVLQGTGGLLDAIGGEAFNRILPGDQMSYREIGSRAADALDLPTAQGSRERVLGDVGEALTGTGLTLGVGGGLNALANVGRSVGAPVVNRLGQFLSAQPGLQTLSTATGTAAGSATREAGGSEGEQAVASLAGGLGPGTLSTAAGAGLRGLVRGRSGNAMQQRMADFNQLGASPSVGQASGNRMVQGAENLLAGGPTSAGVMGRFAEGQADDIGEGLGKLADGLSRNASGERAGRAIEQGAELFGRNIKANKGALYWQADKLIPDTTRVPLSNTWQTVAKLTAADPGAAATTQALVNPRIAQLRQTLQDDLAAGGGTISYQALKRIRTDIGETITDFSMSPDTPTRELRQLYAAMSRDMETAAKAMGPDAERAARRANNYTRVAADRLETIQRIVDKNGGPEKVFTAAMSGTRDGGTTLRAVMQSLPKDGQKAVTAAVIKRMGMATPGAQDAAGETFSAQTFLTNWNKVSPEAKRALFDRYGAGFSKQMDRIASVAQNIRDGSKVFANPSGTANRAAALTYGGSLVVSLFDPTMVSTGGLLTTGVGANWLARKMTDPDFVRMLANSTAMPTGSLLAQIQAMRALGARQGDPETVAMADAMLRSEPGQQKSQ